MTRVLVVDDEIDTLNLLRTILEISGYQAFTTLNSVEAIMLAEMEHPDCILLDIMMPQLDGFTLCKMMRLHPATMNLPIIFVTAYSALDIEERRLEAGADMVLPKPIGMDVLIESVEKATAMRPNRASETRAMPEFLSSKPAAVTAPFTQAAQPASPANGGKSAAPVTEPQAGPKPGFAPEVKPAVTLAAAVKNDARATEEHKQSAASVPVPQPPVAPTVAPTAASTVAPSVGPTLGTKVEQKTEPADGSKPGPTADVKPMDDLPIDIGISPDPVDEAAKEAPSVPPTAKETT